METWWWWWWFYYIHIHAKAWRIYIFHSIFIIRYLLLASDIFLAFYPFLLNFFFLPNKFTILTHLDMKIIGITFCEHCVLYKLHSICKAIYYLAAKKTKNKNTICSCSPLAADEIEKESVSFYFFIVESVGINLCAAN